MGRSNVARMDPEENYLQNEPDFSLMLGGPLYQLYLRTKLARAPLELLIRRMVDIPLICWLPLLLLAAGRHRRYWLSRMAAAFDSPVAS